MGDCYQDADPLSTFEWDEIKAGQVPSEDLLCQEGEYPNPPCDIIYLRSPGERSNYCYIRESLIRAIRASIRFEGGNGSLPLPRGTITNTRQALRLLRDHNLTHFRLIPQGPERFRIEESRLNYPRMYQRAVEKAINIAEWMPNGGGIRNSFSFYSSDDIPDSDIHHFGKLANGNWERLYEMKEEKSEITFEEMKEVWINLEDIMIVEAIIGVPRRLNTFPDLRGWEKIRPRGADWQWTTYSKSLLNVEGEWDEIKRERGYEVEGMFGNLFVDLDEEEADEVAVAEEAEAVAEAQAQAEEEELPPQPPVLERAPDYLIENVDAEDWVNLPFQVRVQSIIDYMTDHIAYEPITLEQMRSPAVMERLMDLFLGFVRNRNRLVADSISEYGFSNFLLYPSMRETIIEELPLGEQIPYLERLINHFYLGHPDLQEVAHWLLEERRNF